MNIQTRKLKFIENFLHVQNEELIYQLEKALMNYNKEHHETFSTEELNERIQKSEEDFKNGKIKMQKDLENQSKNW